MTTEQPTSPRLLRRRTDERVIGGVASGLGDFLNVDPLLVRIGFVGLMVFGGLGLLLYVGGWLLVPEESSDESIAEEALRRTGLTPMRWLLILLFGLGLFVFLGGLGNAYAFSELAIGFGMAIMVMVLGGALFAYSGRLPAVAAPPAAPPARPEVEARPVAEPRRRVRRRRRPRSPLGWYALGAMLAGIGLLALAHNVSGVDVDLGQYFGLALTAIGIALVVGTWWGHARLLILLGVLLLPFAVASSFVTAPIEGGLGFHRYEPASADELHAEYRLLGGRMELDLTQITAADAPIEIAASVTGGQMHLVLPANASVELDAEVGAGELGVLGAWQYGSSLVDRYVRDGSGPRFVLDLELGAGSLWVDGAVPEGR